MIMCSCLRCPLPVVLLVVGIPATNHETDHCLMHGQMATTQNQSDFNTSAFHFSACMLCSAHFENRSIAAVQFDRCLARNARNARNARHHQAAAGCRRLATAERVNEEPAAREPSAAVVGGPLSGSLWQLAWSAAEANVPPRALNHREAPPPSSLLRE